MNITISANDANQTLYDGIKFTTENFEEINIAAVYVEHIDLQTSSPQDGSYDKARITFSKAFEEEQEKVIQRLLERKDIVYMDIFCKNDERSIEVLVPYEEDENGFNRLQNLYRIYSGGVILMFEKEMLE